MLHRFRRATAVLLAAIAVPAVAPAEQEGGTPTTVEITTKVATVAGERRCVLEATLRSPPGARFAGVTLQPLPVIGHHGTIEFEAADGGSPWVAWMPVNNSPDCAGAPRVTGARLVGCREGSAAACAQSIEVKTDNRTGELEVADRAGPEPSSDKGAAIAVRSWRRYLVVAFAGRPPESNFRVCEELTDVRNTSGQALTALTVARPSYPNGDERASLAAPVPDGTSTVVDQRVAAEGDCEGAPPPKPIAIAECTLADGTDCTASAEAFHVGRD